MQVITEQSEQEQQEQQDLHSIKKRNIKMRTVLWSGTLKDGHVRRSSFSITIPIDQARSLGDIMSCQLKQPKGGGNPYLIIRKLDLEGESA